MQHIADIEQKIFAGIPLSGTALLYGFSMFKRLGH